MVYNPINIKNVYNRYTTAKETTIGILVFTIGKHPDNIEEYECYAAMMEKRTALNLKERRPNIVY